MQELEDQLVVCMRCGLCQAVCRLFAATGREADVARGKLALLDGLAHSLKSAQTNSESNFFLVYEVVLCKICLDCFSYIRYLCREEKTNASGPGEATGTCF